MHQGNQLMQLILQHLQQLLKLSCCYSSRRDCLVLDGDTYFSDSFIKTLMEGGVGTTNEDVTIYNEFFEKNNMSSERLESSFITNCMYFPSDLRGHNLISIDELVVLLSNSNNGLFSEYQYVAAKRVEFDIRGEIFKMRIFRRADLLNLCTSNLNSVIAKKKYDAISFEKNHTQSPFKKIAAWIAFRIGYAW